MKLRIKFFACLLLLITFGCTPEEEENVIVEDSNGVTLVRGNFSEFSNLKDLYNETVIRQKEASLHSKDDLYNFEVDSSSVTKVTFANDEYFTFSIERKNNDETDRTFENLIISNKENNTPAAYLLKYSPDEDYLNRIVIDSDAYFSGERTIQPLEFENLKHPEVAVFMLLIHIAGMKIIKEPMMMILPQVIWRDLVVQKYIQ